MDSERIRIYPPFEGVLKTTGERGKIIAYLPKHPPAFIFVSADGKETEIEEMFDIDEVQTFAKETARKTLSPEIRKKIRRRLQEEKIKIEKEIKDAERDLRKSYLESSQRISSNHPAEFITDSSPTLIKQKVENCEKRISKIEQAFFRLDILGNYGICACGCGKEIPISRLMQIPYTSKRADCKEREETGNNPSRKKRPKRR
jgi:RNA polymerase-binding transcription factor DksA